MRLAFVVRLEKSTRPAEGRFEGWVEEVDSCTARRFRSSKELLDFLGQRFDLAIGAAASGGQGAESAPLHAESRKVAKSESEERPRRKAFQG